MTSKRRLDSSWHGGLLPSKDSHRYSQLSTLLCFLHPQGNSFYFGSTEKQILSGQPSLAIPCSPWELALYKQGFPALPPLYGSQGGGDNRKEAMETGSGEGDQGRLISERLQSIKRMCDNSGVQEDALGKFSWDVWIECLSMVFKKHKQRWVFLFSNQVAFNPGASVHLTPYRGWAMGTLGFIWDIRNLYSVLYWFLLIDL